MITVRELRNIFLQCGENWDIDFRKWEHGNEEDFIKRNHYPAPNIVSIKIQEITLRHSDDLGVKIFTYVVEDNFKGDFIFSRDKMIDFFCKDKDDYDLIDFVLYTEDEPGKYNHIPLTISSGDKGYSDRLFIVNLDEV